MNKKIKVAINMIKVDHAIVYILYKSMIENESLE